MTKKQDQEHYYIDLAVSEAKKLVRVIREKNNFPVFLSTGSDLRAMPVYEDKYEDNGVVSLFEFAKEMTPVSITRVAQDNDYLDAYYMNFSVGEDNALSETGTERQIVVARHNYCWTRFYLCKELIHCFVYDTGEERSSSLTNTSDRLSQLIQEMLIPTQNNSCQTLVDFAAYFGAWEFMMPEDTLPLLAKAYDELAKQEGVGQELAYRELAKFIRVPELLVKSKLDQFMRTVDLATR